MQDDHNHIWTSRSTMIFKQAPNTLWGVNPAMTNTLFNTQSRAVSGDAVRSKSTTADIKRRRKNLKKNMANVRAGRKSTQSKLKKKRKILFSKNR